MKKRYKIIIFICVLIIIALTVVLLKLFLFDNINANEPDDSEMKYLAVLGDEVMESVAIYQVKTDSISSYIIASTNITSFNIAEIKVMDNERITELYVNDGEWVSYGQTIMKVIQDEYYTRNIKASVSGFFYVIKEEDGTSKYFIYAIDKTGVTISVKEKDVKNISIGQEAKVSLINSDEVYDGTVTYISKLPNSEGKFYVQISLPYVDGMKYGYQASAKILTVNKEDVIVVPYEVINMDDEDEEQRYYVIEEKYRENFEAGIIEDYMKTYVKTGVFNVDDVEITEGIEPGMKLIYWK